MELPVPPSCLAAHQHDGFVLIGDPNSLSLFNNEVNPGTATPLSTFSPRTAENFIEGNKFVGVEYIAGEVSVATNVAHVPGGTYYYCTDQGLIGVGSWEQLTTPFGETPKLRDRVLATPQYRADTRFTFMLLMNPTLICIGTEEPETPFATYNIATREFSRIANIPGRGKVSHTMEKVDERTVAVAVGEVVEIWGRETPSSAWAMVAQLKHEKSASVLSLAKDPGSLTLCVGTDLGTIHVWDTESWKRSKVLHGHIEPVVKMKYVVMDDIYDNVRLLMTLSSKNVAKFWDPLATE